VSMRQKLQRLLYNNDLAEVRKGLGILVLHPNLEHYLLPQPDLDSNGWWLGHTRHPAPYMAFAQLWWMAHQATQGLLPEGQPKKIRFKGKPLRIIPENISALQNLRELWLQDQELDELPSSLSSLKNLHILGLQRNHLGTLPSWIGDLNNLRVLYVQDNPLSSIPSTISRLHHLREFSAQNCRLQSLPLQFGTMNGLLFVNLQNNLFQNIPNMLYSLPAQTRIQLHKNPIPPDEASTRFLFHDDASSFALSPNRMEGHIPKSKQVERARKREEEREDETSFLERIETEGSESKSQPSKPTVHTSSDFFAPPPTNTLNTAPSNPKSKARLKTLNLKGRTLTEIPIKIKEYKNVQQLILTDNRLTRLPGWINELRDLQVLIMEENQLTDIVPESLHLPLLQHLNFRGNQLSYLPATICLCRKLRYLNLENNNFTELPSILSEVPMLESVRLSGNPLQEFPLLLTRMKNLRYISLGEELADWKASLHRALPNVQIL
jgi:Leucine-rich repeat (LRR) protein